MKCKPNQTIVNLLVLLILFQSLSQVPLLESLSLTPSEVITTQKNQYKSVWFPVTLPAQYQISDLDFFDIEFFNATLGWTCAYSTETGSRDDVIIFQTSDGGQSWQLQFHNQTSYGRSYRLEIVNESTIWVSSTNGLYHTHDQGKNWIYHPKFVNNPTAAIYFFNETHGWAGTRDISLVKTTDGGQTWQSVPGLITPSIANTPRDIIFYNETLGWALTSRHILKTSTGGVTWELQANISAGWSLSLVNDREVWAVGDFIIAHTEDGGESWHSIKNPEADDPVWQRQPYFTDIEFINHDHGWVVGWEPHIAYTPNGGRQWDEQHIDTKFDPRIATIDMYNETLGWAGGTDGLLLRTTNGTYFQKSFAELWFDNWSPVWVIMFGSGLVIVTLIVVFFKKRT